VFRVISEIFPLYIDLVTENSHPIPNIKTLLFTFGGTNESIGSTVLADVAVVQQYQQYSIVAVLAVETLLSILPILSCHYSNYY